MNEENLTPPTQPAGDRPPPRPPILVAIGLVPDDDDDRNWRRLRGSIVRVNLRPRASARAVAAVMPAAVSMSQAQFMKLLVFGMAGLATYYCAGITFQTGLRAFAWWGNAALFQLSLRDFAVCLSGLAAPWITFGLLTWMGRSSRRMFYSTLVVGAILSGILCLLVAAIKLFGDITLGP